MKTSNPFGKKYRDLILPEGTKVIDMPDPACVRNPAQAIRQGINAISPLMYTLLLSAEYMATESL